MQDHATYSMLRSAERFVHQIMPKFRHTAEATAGHVRPQRVRKVGPAKLANFLALLANDQVVLFRSAEPSVTCARPLKMPDQQSSAKPFGMCWRSRSESATAGSCDWRNDVLGNCSSSDDDAASISAGSDLDHVMQTPDMQGCATQRHLEKNTPTHHVAHITALADQEHDVPGMHVDSQRRWFFASRACSQECISV